MKSVLDLGNSHASPNAAQFRVLMVPTFPDMDDEREYVMSRIVPDLVTHSLERGPHAVGFDVDWALADSGIDPATWSGTERDRPFVVGLIGDRTRWMPPVAGVAGNVAEEYPWLADIAARHSSQPAIDLLERIADDPLMRGRIILFRRRRNRGGESSASEREALSRLQRRTRKLGIPLHEYRDCESLGVALRTSLATALDRLHPSHENGILVDRERRSHTAYEAELRVDYVERRGQFTRLGAHADGDGLPLVILGPSGSGKSALIANWAARYQQENPDTVVITHYVGLGRSGGDEFGLVQRIMAEIKDRFGVEEEIPAMRSDLVRRFPEWLNHARGRRLVLAIDALDQLTGDALGLAWLPAYFPPNVRLILSVLDNRTKQTSRCVVLGAALAALLKRKWNAMRIEPLDIEDRRRIIEAVLGRAGTRLSNADRRRLASEPMSNHLLSLRMGLAQLRALGSHDELDEVIACYLSATSPNEVMQHVLSRLEKRHDAALVRDVLSLIWASRRGLSDTELLELTGADSSRLSELIFALDLELMRRQGLLGFFHHHMRGAVEERYSLTGSRAVALHKRLARHFGSQPISPRRADEEPWQWREAHAWKDLERCIADIPMFLQLHAQERDYELLGYWLKIKGKDAMVEAYGKSLPAYMRSARISIADEVDIMIKLGTFFHQASRFEAATLLFREALKLLARSGSAGPAMLATVRTRLGATLRSRGLFDEARELLTAVRDYYESSPDADALRLAEVLDDLGALYYAQRDLDAAESIYTRALEIYQRQPEARQANISNTLSALGAVALEQGHYDKAKQIFGTVLAINQAIYGSHHPATGSALNNIGTALHRKEQYVEALDHVRQAVEIDEQAFGPDHVETASKLNNLGLLLKLTGEYKEAEQIYKRARAIFIANWGSEQLEVASCFNNLGALYRATGRLDEAEAAYREALRIRNKALGPMNLLTINTRLNIAGTLALKGDRTNALRWYQTAIEQKIRVSGPDNPDTLKAMENYKRLKEK